MTTAPLDRLLSRLQLVRDRGSHHMARCPAHDDKNPSLSLTASADGSVLIFCHAGCATADVVEAVGLQLKDLFSMQKIYKEGTLDDTRRSRYNQRPKPVSSTRV